MSTHMIKTEDNCKLELIAIIGDPLPASLRSCLSLPRFNWKYQHGDAEIERVEHVSTVSRFKWLSEFCKNKNINLLTLLIREDKSYVEMLRYAPDYSRVFVYLDNEHLGQNLIINPSKEIYHHWSSVALSGSTSTKSFTYSNDTNINRAVANGFTDWLQEVEKTEKLSEHQTELKQEDMEEKDGVLIHKDCALITRKARLWTGVPNPFKGFEIVSSVSDKGDDWVQLDSFMLEAASTDDEDFWEGDEISLPCLKLSFDHFYDEGDQRRIDFKIIPREDDAGAALLHETLKNQESVMNDANRCQCRIRFTYGKYIYEIYSSSIQFNAELTRSIEAKGVIKRAKAKTGTVIEGTIELSKLSDR